MICVCGRYKRIPENRFIKVLLGTKLAKHSQFTESVPPDHAETKR
jgi:hypothetical protein